LVPDLYAVVQDHLTTHNMGVEPLVVAYSGGLDSACLLRILTRLAPAMSLELLAVTVDHGLRDFEREAEVTTRYSEQLGIRHELVRLPLGLAVRATEGGRSLGEMARLERYEELRRVAAGRAIFLGHHLDDQAETVIMRLMRGTGLHGLGAMRPVAGDLHRPLLAISRRALEDFARSEGVSFAEDPSNASSRFVRNRVRREVLPALESIGAGSVASVARSAMILGEQAEVLGSLVREGLGPHVEECQGGLSVPLSALGTGALRRVRLHWLVSQLLPQPSEARQVLALEQLLLKEGGTVQLNLAHGLVARRQYSTLYLTPDEQGSSPSELALLAAPGEVPWGEWLVRATATVAPDDVASRPAQEAWFSADIVWPLAVRGWQRGDRMRPFGMAGTRLLSDLIGEAKVPRQWRADVPVLEDGAGTIIWVAGVRRGAGSFAVAGEQAVRVTCARKGSDLSQPSAKG
jgi:tRNA(Ile)-lysidine synthase